jgi:hypothetical protein
MAFAAADVPGRIDLLLNGEGYMFAEPEDVEASFGLTPTFVQRSNTDGDYGDNFQDFWLTYTQRDWSLGDGQRYYNSRDESSVRRYFTGNLVDVSKPGQVNLDRRVVTTTPSATPVVCCPNGSNYNTIFYASSTNGYHMDASGASTGLGAHGVGASPKGCCTDGAKVYVSAAGNNVRSWNNTVWATFSATGSDRLAYLNNTLYGYSAGVLRQYDTAGTATTIYTWKDPSGTALAVEAEIIPYGGKLLIFIQTQTGAGQFPNGPELWIYDGVGVSKIADVGIGTEGGVSTANLNTVAVVQGVFFAGIQIQQTDTSGSYNNDQAAIWYYANGSTGYLWKSQDRYPGTTVSLCGFNGGLFWVTSADSTAYFYDPSTGLIKKVGTGTVSPGLVRITSTNTFIAGFDSGATGNIFFGYTGSANTHYAASGSVSCSQTDFGSSLSKVFRSIKVEYEAATGGTVDIAYQVDGVGGSYTTLQTSAASGTEYTISGVTGRTISVKVTLNGNGINPGPTLKRVSVRAVPLQSSFRKNTYIVLLGGRDGKSHCQLRDGTFHPNDGFAQAVNLRSAATAGTPITIVDEFGSYTGVIENENFQLRRYRTNEFLAVVPTREV